GRECALVDIGHRRDLDVAIELPDSPLATVCSHETWEEIVRRMAELIRGHRTTLVFVNTRKLAERIAARLTSMLGEGQVTSHHGSLARERRLDAERRLKEGALRALVATASLELGIDIGDVDRLHTVGRGALPHRDGVHGRRRATRRASITALTSGGAIADTGQYRVVIEPEGTLVGSLDEDFAVEANGGDIFQLGNASWRILRVEPGVVRVADAQGAPPTIPFWLGEAPSRTRELSEAVGRVRVGGRS